MLNTKIKLKLNDAFSTSTRPRVFLQAETSQHVLNRTLSSRLLIQRTAGTGVAF